jgi:hypothetical protein
MYTPKLVELLQKIKLQEQWHPTIPPRYWPRSEPVRKSLPTYSVPSYAVPGSSQVPVPQASQVTPLELPGSAAGN